jgi:hypothetical protein
MRPTRRVRATGSVDALIVAANVAGAAAVAAAAAGLALAVLARLIARTGAAGAAAAIIAALLIRALGRALTAHAAPVLTGFVRTADMAAGAAVGRIGGGVDAKLLALAMLARVRVLGMPSVGGDGAGTFGLASRTPMLVPRGTCRRGAGVAMGGGRRRTEAEGGDGGEGAQGGAAGAGRAERPGKRIKAVGFHSLGSSQVAAGVRRGEPARRRPDRAGS